MARPALDTTAHYSRVTRQGVQEYISLVHWMANKVACLG